MKIKVTTVSLMMVLVISRWGFSADKRPLTGERERLGYALGLQLGSSLKGLADALDFEQFILGVKDAYSGAQPLLSRQETERYQNKVRFDENNKLVLAGTSQNHDLGSALPLSASSVSHREEKPDPGVIKLDLYDLKFDTLEQGGYSFYNLYTNGITPGSTDKDIDIICNALSANEFQSECRSVFSARLKYLLKDDIIEARFVGARPDVKNDQSLVVVTWQEHLTHRDGKKTTKSFKMSVWLKQQQQKWKVMKARVE